MSVHCSQQNQKSRPRDDSWPPEHTKLFTESATDGLWLVPVYRCGNDKRTPSQEDPDPLDELTLMDEAHADTRYGATHGNGEGDTASASPEILSFIQFGSSNRDRES